MFLIAKIVRGRRLLHELEQQEKEKERERERQQQIESGGASLNGASITGSLLPQNVDHINENVGGDKQNACTSNNALTNAAMRRRRFSSLNMRLGNNSFAKTFNVPRSTAAPSSHSNTFNASIQCDSAPSTSSAALTSNSAVLKLHNSVDTVGQPASRRRKKTVRQKTDSSLPNENNEDNVIFSKEFQNNANSQMRRTSSMPSVGISPIINATSNSTNECISRLRHYNYDLKLSKLQKRALRFTWHRLHTRNGGKRVENVFEEVFDRLTKSMPVIREMFTTRIFLSAMSKTDKNLTQSAATLREHARLIVRVIDCVIKNLDTERRTDTGSDFDPIKVGRAHGCLRPYGFVATLWEKLGETIIDVVLSQEAVRDLPGAGQAWVVLAACIVDQLRAGFDSSRDSVQHTKGIGCPITSTQQKQQRYQQQQEQQQQEQHQIQRQIQEQQQIQQFQQQLQEQQEMFQRNLKQQKKCTYKQQTIRFDINDERNEFAYQKQQQQYMEQLYDFHRDENRNINYNSLINQCNLSTYIGGANNFEQSKAATQQFLHQQQQLKQQQESQIQQELLELQQKHHQQVLMMQQHETTNLGWNNREDSTISTASASSGCSTAMRKLRTPNLSSSTTTTTKQPNIDQIYYQQQQQPLSDSQMVYLQQKIPTLVSIHETTSNELTVPNETERNRSRSIVSIKTRLKIPDEIQNKEKLNNGSNTSASLINTPINSRRNSSVEALMTYLNRENNYSNYTVNRLSGSN